MARQNIYTGATPNDGTGDTLRVAFTKTNNNFIELYDTLTYPTPSITYTGTFGNEPSYWIFTRPKKLLQTSNNTFTSTANLYWLDQRFDDGNYDLSGLQSISFNNIGGITDYFDFWDYAD